MTYPQDPAGGDHTPPGGPPAGGPPPGPPPGGGHRGGPTPQDAKNFFSALFDFGFTTYVTPRIIKVVYTLAVILIGLLTLFGVIGALVAMGDNAAAGLATLIVVPVLGLLYLTMWRIGLELVAMLFKVGENVQAIRDRGDSPR